MKPCCTNDGFRLGRSGLKCELHHRISRMRRGCTQRNLHAPSEQELESLFNTLDKMRCPVCGDKMQLMPEGRKGLVTIQHDRDGNVRLLCLACNVRHSDYPADTFYEKHQSEKWCNHCRQFRPLSRFNCDIHHKNGKRSWCKDCDNKAALTRYYARGRKKRRERKNDA